MIDLKEKAKEVAEMLKVISHKDRLQILCFLNDGEKNVTEIVEFLDISQSQTSQFLQKMRLQNIVTSKKNGKEMYYKIADGRILELIKKLKEIYC